MAVTDIEELERLTGVEVGQGRQAVVWMKLDHIKELSKIAPDERPGWYSRAPHIKQAPVYYRRDWCEAYSGGGVRDVDYELGHKPWPVLDLGQASLRIKQWQTEESQRRTNEAYAGKGPKLDNFMEEVYFPSLDSDCDVSLQCRNLFGLSYPVHVERFVREAYKSFILDQKLALLDFAEGRPRRAPR